MSRTQLATPVIPGGAVVGPPTTGTHKQFEVWADSAGTLWVCTAAGTPGTWASNPVSKVTNVGGAQIVSNDNALNQPILQDTFVAARSTVVFDVTVSGLAIGPSRFTINLLVGSAGGTFPLFTSTGTPGTGVTVYNLGAIWADAQDTLHRSVIVTGLTPGSTYPWQIIGAVVGGSWFWPSRSDTATWTTASSLITDASIKLRNQGMPVSGTGIPAGACVGNVVEGVEFQLSASPTSQVNLLPSSGTGATIVVGAFNNCKAIAQRTGIAPPHNVDKAWVANYNGVAGGAQVIPILLGGRGLGNQGNAAHTVETGSYIRPSDSGGQTGLFQHYGAIIGNPIQNTQLSNASGLAVTPDGSKVVAVGFGNPRVEVYNADNDTLQFSYSPAPLTITAATNATTTVTATIGTHNFVVGQMVSIGSAAGGTWANINGDWTVTATTATTISFVVTTAPTGTYTASSGLAYYYVSANNVCCDNTYAYIVDYYAHGIVRMNLTTGAISSLLLPAAPYGIAITPDLTTIMVAMGNGQVQKVTASTFVLSTLYNCTTGTTYPNGAGTAGAVGAATVPATYSACYSDNNTFWCVWNTTTVSTLCRINMTSGAITLYPLPFANAVGLAAASWSSRADSTGVSATNGSPVILDPKASHEDQYRAVVVSGMSGVNYVGTVIPGVSFRLSSSPTSQVDTNYTGTTGAVTATLSGTTNGWGTFSGNQFFQPWFSGPYMGQIYVSGSFGLSGSADAEQVAITNDGQIYVAMGVENGVWCWPGATFQSICTAPGYWNDVCEVVVEGGT